MFHPRPVTALRLNFVSEGSGLRAEEFSYIRRIEIYANEDPSLMAPYVWKQRFFRNVGKYLPFDVAQIPETLGSSTAGIHNLKSCVDIYRTCCCV
jgi:hypothetical protein